VVSTVAGGLETPDFLDLRKNAGVRTLPDPADSGPKQLYQVVPEKQTAIRGLMGSERGYDVAGLAGPNVPVLGQERRGTKVRLCPHILARSDHCPFDREKAMWKCLSTRRN
jgi:splicing factor 3B subunit 2